MPVSVLQNFDTRFIRLYQSESGILIPVANQQLENQVLHVLCENIESNPNCRRIAFALNALCLRTLSAMDRIDVENYYRRDVGDGAQQNPKYFEICAFDVLYSLEFATILAQLRRSKRSHMPKTYLSLTISEKRVEAWEDVQSELLHAKFARKQR